MLDNRWLGRHHFSVLVISYNTHTTTIRIIRCLVESFRCLNRKICVNLRLKICMMSMYIILKLLVNLEVFVYGVNSLAS